MDRISAAYRHMLNFDHGDPSLRLPYSAEPFSDPFTIVDQLFL